MGLADSVGSERRDRPDRCAVAAAAEGVDRRVQALVAVPVRAGFVVLAGGGASVVRAAAMGAVALLALAAGRASRGAARARCRGLRAALPGPQGYALRVSAPCWPFSSLPLHMGLPFHGGWREGGSSSLVRWSHTGRGGALRLAPFRMVPALTPMRQSSGGWHIHGAGRRKTSKTNGNRRELFLQVRPGVGEVGAGHGQ